MDVIGSLDVIIEGTNQKNMSDLKKKKFGVSKIATTTMLSITITSKKDYLISRIRIKKNYQRQKLQICK